MPIHWLLDYKAEEATSTWLKAAFWAAAGVLLLRLILTGLLIFGAGANPMPGFSEEWIIIWSALPFQLALLIPLAAAWLAGGKGFGTLTKMINWNSKYIEIATGLELLLLPTIALITISVRQVFHALNLSVEAPALSQYLLSCPKSCFMIIAASAILLAPFFEEFFFRRILFEYLCPQLGVLASAVLCSLLFSTIHGSLLAMPGLFVLGLTLQLLYIRHRSLYPAILLHAIHNSVTLALFALSKLPLPPAS